ncbi:MAG: thioredoxin family protein [Gemmatimonadales bacterium]|jgi:thioredoxin 1
MSTAGVRARLATAPRPVVIEVSASWCGHCRATASVADQLAAQYRNRVELWRVDADAAREDAVALGVHALPTYVAFRGSREVGRTVGRQSRRRLGQAFEAALTGRPFGAHRLGWSDRVLRSGAGAALAWAAWGGDSPVLLGVALAAFASAFYDLLPMRRRDPSSGLSNDS